MEFFRFMRFAYLRLAYIVLTLIGLFWSYEALAKYYKEPAKTTVRFQIDDVDKGAEFPLVTFCDQKPKHVEFMKDFCGLNLTASIGFHDLLLECLQQRPEIDLKDLQWSLKNISGYSVYSILHINGIFNGYGFDDEWTSIYHPIYGYCDTFELNLFQDVTEQFMVQFPISSKDKIVFFHSKNDLPDSSDTLVNLGNNDNVTNTLEVYNIFKAVVGKKVFSQTPLQRSPCTEYQYLTCQNIKMVQTLGCQAQILYSGKHLNKFDSVSESCTNEQVEQALSKSYDCLDLPQCTFEEFSLEFNEGTYPFDYEIWVYVLEVRLGKPMIQTTRTVLGYNVQNLIGEIGGTFGIAIGICIFDVILFLMKVLPQNNPYHGYLKDIFRIILLLIFIHWSTQSLIRYDDETVSTEVEFELTDQIVDEFPLLTFCPVGMIQFVDYLKVSGNSLNIIEDFSQALEMALLEGLDLDWAKLNQSIFYDINSLIDSVLVQVNGKDFELDSNLIWSKVFHSRHGLCYTLDIQKDIPIIGKTQGPIYLSIIYKENTQYPVSSGEIFLHGSMDLPSAHQHSSALDFYSFDDGVYVSKEKNILQYNIVKTKIESEPTKQFPCSLEFFQTCVDREWNKMIQDIEECHLPILQTGRHVLVDLSLPACSSNVTLLAFTFYKNAAEEYCPKEIPCQTTQYSKLLPSSFKNKVALDFIDFGQTTETHLSIGMTEKVEKYTSKIDFKFDSLVAEVGGTMGLFLGWSIYSLFQNLFKKGNFWFPLSIVVYLLMASAIWSQGSLNDYLNEKVTMEFQIERENNKPYITFCPYWFVMFVINDNFPCARIFQKPNFIGALKLCLSEHPNMIDILEAYFWVHEEYGLKPEKIQLISNSGKILVLETNLTEKVFHSQYGPCYSLDPRHWNQNYSRIEFYFVPNAVPFKVFIHNGNDFAVAQDEQPSFWFETHPESSRYLDVKTKKWSKPLIRSNPCAPLWPKVCQEVELQNWILKRFGCKVDFLYSGPHLEKLENRGQCNLNSTLTILQNMETTKSTCPRLVPCEYTSYQIIHDKIQIKPHQSYFSIGFKDDIIEKQFSYVSVDEQTLISQLGGILSINLGWSFVTLLDFIEIFLDLWA